MMFLPFLVTEAEEEVKPEAEGEHYSMKLLISAEASPIYPFKNVS